MASSAEADPGGNHQAERSQHFHMCPWRFRHRGDLHDPLSALCNRDQLRGIHSTQGLTQASIESASADS